MSVVLAMVLVLLYWMPTIVAALRKTDNIAQVAVMNFFGFTGVFWVIALVFALKPETTTAQPMTVQLPDAEAWKNRGKHNG